ncbi:MFS transporter [Ruania albidiflava]|uniref:MFS transporter n=3 Tax=Ruania albidiflava TaxID=366586 RepID=UPI0003B4B7A3|nr:MFS transporter [Ruania albidiflava]
MTSPTAARPGAAAQQPVGPGWLLGFAAAWFGFWLLVMLPGQFMVVKLASVIDPVDKVALSSALIAVMAVVIVVSVPIVGWLCDRSRPRFGRRRTWALAGLLLGTVPFAFVGFQQGGLGAGVLLALVALGEAIMLVSLSAIIADRVPHGQRGSASAAMGVPQVIALAGGMVLVTEVITDVGHSWLVIAVLALLCPLPFLLRYREVEAPPTPSRRWAAGGPRRRVDLARYHDYTWALVSRVLINGGNLVGTTYLLYFLADVLGLPDPDGALLVLVLVYLLACGLASWAGGRLTDRVGRRRPFVAVAGALQAAAALTLALVPTWDAAIVAAVLLGLGFGTFLSVDQALLTDVLPDPATRARDLGIVNSAQHLPMAPLVGWAVLSVAGYSELYVVAAVIMLAGAAAVYQIRSVA